MSFSDSFISDGILVLWKFYTHYFVRRVPHTICWHEEINKIKKERKNSESRGTPDREISNNNFVVILKEVFFLDDSIQVMIYFGLKISNLFLHYVCVFFRRALIIAFSNDTLFNHHRNYHHTTVSSYWLWRQNACNIAFFFLNLTTNDFVHHKRYKSDFSFIQSRGFFF